MCVLTVGNPLLHRGFSAGFKFFKFGFLGFGALLHFGVFGDLGLGRRFGLKLIGLGAFHALGISGRGGFNDGLLRFEAGFGLLLDLRIGGEGGGLLR